MKRRKKSFYAVGRVTKVFGVRGEIIVRPMTDSPARFQKLRHVYVGRGEVDASAFDVTAASVGPRGVRLHLAEVRDRTHAEKLVGHLVFVDEAQRIRPARGAHYVHEIIGLRVEDDQGKVLGVVKEVLRLPAQDVYVVERNGSEWMLPAVRDFVTLIDCAGGRMVVRLIKGLLE